MPTVLMAGGGTGGHIFPGIAIARELVERVPRCEVLFVGTRRGLESRIVPAEGFRLLTIDSVGITGKRIAARLKGLALLPLSLVQSMRLIGSTKPSLVVGVGGYASGPVMAAAVLRRVPTLIHEQNYVPGATNRWMAPFVSKVVVTFEETIARLGGRGVALGNPVRREFALVKPRPHAGERRRLLVFGGSQGSRVLNKAMVEALPDLAGLRGSLQITHQAGEAEHAAVASSYRAAGLTGEDCDVRPFISGMSQAFEDADLIVSRSGATTVAELTASGRPAVLIPFAGATHDHQTFNARKLADAGAAVVIGERDLTGALLARTVRDLLADPGRLDRMATASRSLGRPDAAARIAELCIALIATSATSATSTPASPGEAT